MKNIALTTILILCLSINFSVNAQNNDPCNCAVDSQNNYQNTTSDYRSDLMGCAYDAFILAPETVWYGIESLANAWEEIDSFGSFLDGSQGMYDSIPEIYGCCSSKEQNWCDNLDGYANQMDSYVAHCSSGG